jgi:hypothetical protein
LFYHHEAAVGVARGWKVEPVASFAQLSDVFSLVTPWRMPVTDHEEMGSSDELVSRLLDILELTARALNRDALQNALDARTGQTLRQLQKDPAALRKVYDEAIGTYQPPVPKRPGHRPNEKEMRDYAAFRKRFQKLEREIRRDKQLTSEDPVDREMMFANGGEHPKAMMDHMLWHGLQRHQWPPSTWPEEAPETPGSGQKNLF